jgi:antirestriction protein ArdC
MRKTGKRSASGEVGGKRRGLPKASLYSEITDRIIADLERGSVPWVKPWGRAQAALGLPKNAATGRTYSGINILILWGAVIERGYPGQNWLTFRQALSLGGNVRKGEHGTTIVHADRFIPKNEKERAKAEDNEPQAVPFLKRFTVFNVAQCEGLPEHLYRSAGPLPERQIIPQAEALVRASGADIRIGGDRAFYMPAGDFIQLPPQPAFFQQINYYRTCFHELGHNADIGIMGMRPAMPPASAVTSAAPSAPRNMLSRNWSPYLDSLYDSQRVADVDATGLTEAVFRPAAALPHSWRRPAWRAPGELNTFRRCQAAGWGSGGRLNKLWILSRRFRASQFRSKDRRTVLMLTSR